MIKAGYIQSLFEALSNGLNAPRPTSIQSRLPWCSLDCGSPEKALQWLEQAFVDRDVHMVFLLDDKWNGLRSNQKFLQLLSRVGFPASDDLVSVDDRKFG